MPPLRSPQLLLSSARAAHARQRPVHRTRCRPSRLTLGAAAGTVVAAVTALIVASVSGGAGTSSRSASASYAATISPATTASHAGQAEPGPTGLTGQRSASRPQSASQHQPASRPQPPAAHQTARGQHGRPAKASPAPQAKASPSQPAEPATPAQPYLIYDSVTPGAIPPGHMVATYATGRYAASPSEVAGRGPVLWIDTTGTDYAASALDVEPGNVTPDQAATWAYHRLSSYPDAIAHIYTFIAEWPAVQAAIATLPASMQARVRWWIADPTGVPHIVPGSSATQWYWGPNYDISTALPNF